MVSPDWTPTDRADAADDQRTREWWKNQPDPDAWQDRDPDEDMEDQLWTSNQETRL